MPLPHNGPVALHGAPLTPPPPSGPHKPNLAIQARLAPELIAAIIEARKKGQQLQFEAYGPNAGFHIDGQHFPIHSVAAERTPHEVYAYNALPQPTLQVIGKVVGKCYVQRTLTEEDQEKLRQSHSAAETASQRTIARVGVPEAPVKTGVKRKPATATVRKNVLTADALAALRASPAPGTAGNSPPPGAPSRSSALDGPPNPFQTLLIHHLAYAPSTLKNLASAVKRQPKEIRGCLDSIATNDDSSTGPRPDVPTWTLKPSAYQYLRLAPSNGSASGGPWLTLSPDDIKRITADANRAFDELKLPPDAPPRAALAAQKPAPPAAPPAPVPKPQETTLKHPLPARPTPAAGISNGRLDIPRPPRVASPAAVVTPEIPAPAREVGAAPVRPPVRASAPTKEKVKATEGDIETPKDTPVKKSKTKTAAGTNGKEKSSKIKSKPIISADSDGEDFVTTKRDRERKLPPPIPAPIPVPTPTPTPTPAPVPPRTTAPVPPHSRTTSSSSSRLAEPSTAGAKRAKRDADIAALELEREIDAPDSGYGEPSRSAVTVTVTSKTALEGKKRRVNQDETRVREVVKTKDIDRPREGDRERDRERPKEGKAGTGAVRDPARVAKAVPRDASEVKRKRRDMDQESDVSFDPRDADVKKKRRVEAVGAAPALTKRDKAPREREVDSSTVEARPKKPLPIREPDSVPRVKEKVRKSVPTKTNGASTSAAATPAVPTAKKAKANGLSKKERITYTSSEDESTPPAPRRTAPAPAPPPARPVNPPAPSPSEGSTPRERERDRERDRRRPPRVVIPPKRPPLSPNASAADVRDRYSEVYADYTTMGAQLAAERFKVQKLLRDIEEGDHEGLLESSVVESLTKAYLEAHEELTALKVRLGSAS